MLKIINMENDSIYVESIEEADCTPFGDLDINENLVLVSINPDIYPKNYIEAEDVLEIINARIYKDEDGSVLYTDDEIEMPSDAIYAVISSDVLALFDISEED